MDVAIPFIEPDARFALWGFVTIVTAFFVSGWMFVGGAVASEYGPWDFVGRVEAFIIGVVISAQIGGPAAAGALMIYEAAMVGASSVPGSVWGWIVRSAACTAGWFVVVLGVASAFERMSPIIVVVSWWLSMAAAVGVLVLFGLGS